MTEQEQREQVERDKIAMLDAIMEQGAQRALKIKAEEEARERWPFDVTKALANLGKRVTALEVRMGVTD